MRGGWAASLGPFEGFRRMWTGIRAGPRVLEAGQRGRGRAAFARVAFEGFARPRAARGGLKC